LNTDEKQQLKDQAATLIAEMNVRYGKKTLWLDSLKKRFPAVENGTD
jgi:hypothetical protein